MGIRFSTLRGPRRDELLDRDAGIEEKLGRGVFAFAEDGEDEVDRVHDLAGAGVKTSHVDDLLRARRQRQRSALEDPVGIPRNHLLHRLGEILKRKSERHETP